MVAAHTGIGVAMIHAGRVLMVALPLHMAVGLYGDGRAMDFANLRLSTNQRQYLLSAAADFYLPPLFPVRL